MGWLPVAGDWDNEEDDTGSFYKPANRTWYLRNEFSDDAVDITFQFLSAPSTWLPPGRMLEG